MVPADGYPEGQPSAGIRPGDSLFNRVLDLDWIYPPGYTEFCGGDALMRRTALEEVDGAGMGGGLGRREEVAGGQHHGGLLQASHAAKLGEQPAPGLDDPVLDIRIEKARLAKQPQRFIPRDSQGLF